MKSLDTSLACFDSEVVNGCIRIYAVSTLDSAVCPYCGTISNRLLHSRKREIMDVPFAGRPVKILLNTRQFHCCNADCSVKSFTERFSFLVPYSFKSNRLLSKM